MIADEGAGLTQISKTAGCAVKIGPGTLAGILEGLSRFQNENLLVGIEASDDGATYEVSDEVALIQTLGFFTPVVDGPYTLGQVTAANALSGIYVMGGEPRVALNIVAWPNCVNPRFLGEIPRGGADKVTEAGVVLTEGHSTQGGESKYDLSVTDSVHLDQVFKNYDAMLGDVLTLTKPLGTGIVNIMVKAEMASPEVQQGVIQVMTTLNKKAKQIIEKYEVHSCIDVAGFGLVGYNTEMAEGDGVTFDIEMGRLPIQQAVAEHAQMGLILAGAYRNRNSTEEKIEMGNVEEHLPDTFFDPQTSGGLLVSVAPEVAEKTIKEMEQSDMVTTSGIIRTVAEKQEKYVRLR